MMPNDFNKKQPTKTERIIYDLAMRMEVLDRSLWSTSAHIIALGIVMDVEPEKIAEILANGGDKIQEYGKRINAYMEKADKEKAEKNPEQASGHEHSHDHNHDHNHDHAHPHEDHA
jgi:hypothetical protein